jgi:hypothetical protein
MRGQDASIARVEFFAAKKSVDKQPYVPPKSVILKWSLLGSMPANAMLFTSGDDLTAGHGESPGGNVMAFRRRALVRGAMVGGAAYYAGRRVAQGENREAEQEERLQMLEAQQQYPPPPQYSQPPPQYSPPPPPPAPPPARSIVQELSELKNLFDAGVLTQAEFDAQKARILAG